MKQPLKKKTIFQQCTNFLSNQFPAKVIKFHTSSAGLNETEVVAVWLRGALLSGSVTAAKIHHLQPHSSAEMHLNLLTQLQSCTFLSRVGGGKSVFLAHSHFVLLNQLGEAGDWTPYLIHHDTITHQAPNSCN